MGMGLPTPDSWPSASINPSLVNRECLLYGGLAYIATLGQAGGLMRCEKGRAVSAASHLCEFVGIKFSNGWRGRNVPGW
jgi:hypothetical protein